MAAASSQPGPSPEYGTAVLYPPRGDGGTLGLHYSVAAGTFVQVVQLEYEGLTASPLLAESHAVSAVSRQVTCTLDAGEPGLVFSWVVSNAEVTTADLGSASRSNFFNDLVQDRVVRAAGTYALTGADDAGVWTAHQVLFGLMDAGVADAGVADGGAADAGADDAVAVDAGAGDAGTDAGAVDAGVIADGGVSGPNRLTVGCGCGASGEWPGTLLGAVLLGLRARSRSRSRSRSRGRSSRKPAPEQTVIISPPAP